MKRRIHNRVRAARARRAPLVTAHLATEEGLHPFSRPARGLEHPPEDSHADLVRGGPVAPAQGELELIDERDRAPQRTAEEFLRDMAREDARRRGEALGEPEE